MKNYMKFASFLILLAMFVLMCIPAYAANDKGVEYSINLDKPSITASNEEQTIVMTVKTNQPVDLDAMSAQVELPDGFIITAIANETLSFVKNDVNLTNGKISWSYDYSEADYLTVDVLAVVTFTVPANTMAGEYEINYVISDIACDWGETWESGTTVSTILTIKEAAPACEHTETKLVSNDNLTHKVVCANEECKYVLNEEEQCVATKDGDCTTDDKCECGYVITSARDAHVPEEDDFNCATPAKCVYCDYVVTEAQAHAFNNKPSDILKDGAGCENAAQYYVQCDNCNEVNFEKTVEVGDPRGHGTLNGFRLDPNSDGTHNVVCNDCNEATEENVKCTVDDTKTWYGDASPAQCCVAGDAYKYTSCECGYGFEAEEVKGYYPATKEHILNKIEKVPNCKDAGYSAYWECTVMCYHFSDEAGTQRIDDLSAWIDVGGEGYRPVDRTNHYLDTVYYIYNDDAHSSYYDCCNTPVVTDAPHEVDPDTHECFCGFVEHVCEHSKYETTETTHKSICQCGAPLGDAEPHDFNNDAHKCVCGAVEKFTLTISDFNDNFIEREVPYGTNILEYANSLVNSGVLNIDAFYENYFEDDYAIFGKRVFNTWMYSDEDYFQYVVPAEMIVEQDITVSAESTFTGWITYDGENWAYEVNSTRLEGWYQINESDYTVNGTGSAWYYFDENGYRVSGLTRVPYPTVEINGIKYAPNAADKAYWEAHKDTSKYTDATSALFVFGEDGKFDATTQIIAGSYSDKGMIAWHPGFVNVNDEWMYFVGDETCGNKAANGLIYVTRNAEAAGFKSGDKVSFVDGKVANLNGVVEISDVKYYYENGKLAMGKGLVKLANGEYIYVRSNGMLAMGQYYLPMGLELASGMYQIDSNGFIIDPVSSDKNGIHDGYYYVDGKITYAGLIEFNNAIYYINSKGQVVTGEYYVTKISAELADTYSAGDKLIFGEDGKMETIKNGIVEEDGKYYFYENNHIKYGAGVVEIEENVFIYVRSNGELATGEYWPTKTNGLLERGKYNWGTDGKYYAD